MKAKRRLFAEVSVLALSLLAPPQTVCAELTGKFRKGFLYNFVRECNQSVGSRNLITSHGSGAKELKAYCECVSVFYADNLDEDKVVRGLVSERRRLQIANASRKACLERIF